MSTSSSPRTTQNGQQTSETIARQCAGHRHQRQARRHGAPDPAATPESAVSPARRLPTLELDQMQAEVITNATAMGKLTLVLRSLTDFGDKVAPVSANQSIRLPSPFWTN